MTEDRRQKTDDRRQRAQGRGFWKSEVGMRKIRKSESKKIRRSEGKRLGRNRRYWLLVD
jgi:hypothetical protein